MMPDQYIKELAVVVKEYWEIIIGTLAGAYAFASYMKRRIMDPTVRRSEMAECEKRICNHQDRKANEINNAISRLHERVDQHLNESIR